jgi:RimJ/RimL family protein N-acetyltransferase
MQIELAQYAESDLALTAELELDPEVMRELGGPTDPARFAELHRIRVADPLYFKIVADGTPAGTIGAWEKTHHGEQIFETGWMVLPRFQRRGIASAGLQLLIARVRSEPRLDSISAFPPVTNTPSNGLCRKSGFELLGALEFIYAGRRLQCNHWKLDTPPLA